MTAKRATTKRPKTKPSPKLDGAGPQRNAATPDAAVAASPRGVRYIEGIGRRKSVTARVRLYETSAGESVRAGKFTINEKSYQQYFPLPELQEIILQPLETLDAANRFRVTVAITGGGVRGQAEAVRHGLSRALVQFDEEFHQRLKRLGYLMRDPRKKERRKYGLKKARRAPQWSKR